MAFHETINTGPNEGRVEPQIHSCPRAEAVRKPPLWRRWLTCLDCSYGRAMERFQQGLLGSRHLMVTVVSLSRPEWNYSGADVGRLLEELDANIDDLSGTFRWT